MRKNANIKDTASVLLSGHSDEVTNVLDFLRLQNVNLPLVLKTKRFD